MYYVYLLQNYKDSSFYIGYAKDLKKRFSQHNNELSQATKYKRSYRLLFYEAFLNNRDAKRREEYVKSGWGFRSIKKLLEQTLRSLL